MGLLGKDFKHRARIFSILGIVLILSACGTTRTYSGASLQPDKVAIIEDSWNEYFIISITANINKFDGKDISSDKVEALAGQHEIVVNLTYYQGLLTLSGDPETYTINVEAGHKYRVNGNWNGGINQIWIEDEASGAVIAGNKQVVTPIQGAKEGKVINSISMTCKSPYLLEQDCSIWSGATRSIVIDGFEVKVAGSKDGKVVLVMDSKWFSNSFSHTHSKASNNSYYAIKKVLDAEKIEIIRVSPMKSFGNIDGYILELAEDGYSVLKNYHSNPVETPKKSKASHTGS